MASIEINGQKYTGPDGWSDLDQQGLLHVARLQPFLAISDRAKYLLISYLFHVPLKQFLLLKKPQMVQLEPLLSWIFTKNKIKKWLVGHVSILGNPYFGPQNALSDLSADEFTYAEASYERYLDEQKEEHLHTLFAILYRESNWWTGKKPAFDAKKLDKSIKKTRLVQLFVKQAVLINYAGCRNFMISVHPHVWKPVLQEKLNNDAAPKITSWAKIFLNLAGDKFGTYEQTMASDVWLVLADMESKAKQVAELEAKS